VTNFIENGNGITLGNFTHGETDFSDSFFGAQGGGSLTAPSIYGYNYDFVFQGDPSLMYSLLVTNNYNIDSTGEGSAYIDSFDSHKITISSADPGTTFSMLVPEPSANILSLGILALILRKRRPLA
jgi:hypothetical protein